MNALEVLYAARASITGETFAYGEWNKCTCGHIYQAIAGKSDVKEDEVIDNNNHPVFQEIAAVLNWVKGCGMSAGVYISDYTYDFNADYDDYCVTAEDAITVINEAIARIEAEQEHARLDVLAQSDVKELAVA